MKVLYLVDSLGVGGAERSLLALAARMERWQARFCTIFDVQSSLVDHAPLSPPVDSLGLGESSSWFSSARRLRKLVHDHQPDLIHVAGTYASLVSLFSAIAGLAPVVESFNNEAFTERHFASVPPTSTWKLRLLRVLYRLQVQRSAAVVAISVAVRDSNCAALKIPSSKVRVIYRGRCSETFAPGRASSNLRHELSLTPENLVVLNVARLIPRKGQEVLLRAFLDVVRRFPNARLLLVGDGHDRARLWQLVTHLSLQHHVALLGTRRDVPDLLRAADLFVFPSSFEGHGGALVEAMLSGLPIVASDTSVHRESVEHERTGLLVPVGNVTALSGAISRLLAESSLRVQLGSAARQVAKRRFSVHLMASAHEELYDSVTGLV